MAGDWIKMRADLHTHPKVVRIASALNADRLLIVGGLHAVWCLFDMHSEDGKLSGYTTKTVDDLIGCAGFAHAMCAVRWLVSEDDGLSLPEFDEHNGQSAKRRAAETKRKRNEREAGSSTARKSSASNADKTRTREEKKHPLHYVQRMCRPRLPVRRARRCVLPGCRTPTHNTRNWWPSFPLAFPWPSSLTRQSWPSTSKSHLFMRSRPPKGAGEIRRPPCCPTKRLADTLDSKLSTIAKE